MAGIHSAETAARMEIRQGAIIPIMRTSPTVLAFVGWLRPFLAEADASLCASAPSYGFPEDVGVIPVIIAERELCDVERQILRADFVERAHDAALQQRPKAVDRAGVDGTDNIFSIAMLNEGVRIVSQSPVATVLVAGQQINLSRNCLANEALQRRSIGIADDAGDHAAVAFHRADHDFLASCSSPLHPLVFVAVLVLSTDVGLIDLHDADQLAKLWIDQTGADAVTHIMGCPVGAEAHDAQHLQGRDAFLACQHHVDDAEPIAQPDLGILENRLDQHGEAIALVRAIPTEPMERADVEGIDLIVAAAGTLYYSIGPATASQIRLTSIVSGEQQIEFCYGHLAGELGLAHRTLPATERHPRLLVRECQ